MFALVIKWNFVWRFIAFVMNMKTMKKNPKKTSLTQNIATKTKP